jgi:hypothetical protein
MVPTKEPWFVPPSVKNGRPYERIFRPGKISICNAPTQTFLCPQILVEIEGGVDLPVVPVDNGQHWEFTICNRDQRRIYSIGIDDKPVRVERSDPVKREFI